MIPVRQAESTQWKQVTAGEDTAQGTSPHSVSVFQCKRGFPSWNWNAKDIGRRGYIGATMLHVTTASDLCSGTSNSTSTGAQGCCDLENLEELDGMLWGLPYAEYWPARAVYG